MAPSELYAEARRVAHDVLAIDTTTHRGTRRLMDYLLDQLDFGDFRIVEQVASFESGDRSNLVGRRGPAGDGGLLMCTSVLSPPTDEAAASKWTETEEDPFNPTERDGLLFGLGAVGGKIDLMCKVIAATSFEADELKLPVIVAGLFGTDSRVGGAMYLLDSGICDPQWALVGASTSLELVVAHRGYMQIRINIEQDDAPSEIADNGLTFRVRAIGESAHSAMPSIGRNAIAHAVGTIHRWKESQRDFSVHSISGGDDYERVPDLCEFFVHVPSGDWTPSGPFLEIEAVPSSTKLGPNLDGALASWHSLSRQLYLLFRWTAPETAPDFMPSVPICSTEEITSDDGGDITIRIGYRTLPGERGETLIQDADALARRVGQDSTVSCRMTVEKNLLPMDGDWDTHLVREAKSALSEFGVPPVTGTYSGYSEGWIFHSSKIETVVFGPGNGIGVAHRPNEHTVLTHIEKAVSFYRRIIQKLCC